MENFHRPKMDGFPFPIKFLQILLSDIYWIDAWPRAIIHSKSVMEKLIGEGIKYGPKCEIFCVSHRCSPKWNGSQMGVGNTLFGAAKLKEGFKIVMDGLTFHIWEYSMRNLDKAFRRLNQLPSTFFLYISLKSRFFERLAIFLSLTDGSSINTKSTPTM